MVLYMMTKGFNVALLKWSSCLAPSRYHPGFLSSPIQGIVQSHQGVWLIQALLERDQAERRSDALKVRPSAMKVYAQPYAQPYAQLAAKKATGKQ